MEGYSDSLVYGQCLIKKLKKISRRIKEKIMEKHNNQNSSIVTSSGSRPMKVFVDSNGYEWLCDKDVDPNGNFSAQGCWRSDHMEFDRNF